MLIDAELLATTDSSTDKVFARRLAAAIVLQAVHDLGAQSPNSHDRPSRKAKGDAVEFLAGTMAHDIARAAGIPPGALRKFAVTRSRELRQAAALKAAMKAALPAAAEVREAVC